MEYDEWEPIYEQILADFGYGRAGDEAARDQLRAFAEPFDAERLDCAGQTVAIAGAGPSLTDELDRARRADRVFAASVAAERLAEQGVGVDAMVTDLDKTPAYAARRTREGAVTVIHAHGDNRDALTERLPDCDPANVLATTQAAPAGPVVNFGGFTDGDRAAYTADALGASELLFLGWDFDDPTLSEPKARKLSWAERLLELLERRRGERFAVLAGRRESIDPL